MERLGTVAIIGVGLIGGSVGLALRARGLAHRVVGIGRAEATLAEAVRLGAIDSFTTDLDQGVAEAEVVVVCTPVTQIAEDVQRAARQAPEHVLITDAGSTKQRIVDAVERHPRSRATFVGAHPIAGSERKGVVHARADLFQDRACVLATTRQTPRDRYVRARGFWIALGCRLFQMAPDAHDTALAYTSHLPHAVAALLALAVPAALLPFAAGAYRDGTRVAGADPALWTDIFLDNRAVLVEALGEFQDLTANLKMALMGASAEGLRSFWDAAHACRERFDAQRP